ncbi:MAG: hypothetical protein ACI4QR_03610, partial [Eubacteriales bacterium]
MKHSIYSSAFLKKIIAFALTLCIIPFCFYGCASNTKPILADDTTKTEEIPNKTVTSDLDEAKAPEHSNELKSNNVGYSAASDDSETWEITNYTPEEIKADPNLYGLGEKNTAFDHSHYVVAKVEGTKVTITRNGESSDGVMYAFQRIVDYISMTDVVICPGIVGIGDNAFAGCDSLSNISIPE